jgi:hypothetical protein
MFVLKVAIAAALASLICSAQDDARRSIQIGETLLRLGMSKTDVLTKLGRQYQVKKMDDAFNDIWTIGDPHSPLGNVRFISDKLSGVSSEIGVFWDAAGGRTMNALFRSLEALTKRTGGSVPMFVKTEQYTGPGSDAKDAEIRFRNICFESIGDKRSCILIVDRIGKEVAPQISITEELASRDTELHQDTKSRSRGPKVPQ